MAGLEDPRARTPAPWLRALAAAVLLVLLPTPPAVADDEVVVPENCWPMRGGGPTRSGYSRTRPLTGLLDIAWSRDFDGAVVGEPLVWDDTVLVETEKGDLREVHLVDLATGEPRGRPLRLKGKGPLRPSVWGRYVALASDGEVVVYERERTRLSPAWSEVSFGLRDHALVEGVLAVATDSHVVGRRRRGAQWSAFPSVGEISSALVLDHGRRFWVTYDTAGNAHLGGSLRGFPSIKPLFLGHHGGRRPEYLAELVFLGRSLFVELGLPVALEGGKEARQAWVHDASGGGAWKVRGFLRSAAPPAGTADRWVGFLDDDAGAPQLVLHDDAASEAMRGAVLASRENHSELADPARLTIVRDVLHTGRWRVDLETFDIYDPLPVTPRGRVVPARDTLLAITGDRTLVALREAGVEDPSASALTEEPAPGVAGRAGHLVDAEGNVRRVRFEGSGPDAKANGKPLSALQPLLARAEDGSLLHAPSPTALLRGLVALAEEEEGREYARLGTEAVKALDMDLARRFVLAAEERGAGAQVTKWTLKRVDELGTTEADKKPRAEAVRALLVREQEALRRGTEWIWATCARLPAATPWHWRSALLRAVLVREPGHEAALAAVKAAIPAGMPLPEGFDAERWLLLADASQTASARLASAEGVEGLHLEMAQRLWRADVVGIRSQNLLILTPTPDPAQVAASLATGELVCQTLEGLFGKAPEGAPPLVLHLFPTQEEYLRQSGGHGHGPLDEQAKASAGHYDPGLGISRIYIPRGKDPFERVHKTYAHELVHHWLDQRCPLPRTQDRRGYGVDTPGFWLVEGIAELFAELEFDLRRGVVRTAGGREPSLDTVAHAPRGRLIRWEDLLALDQRTFGQLRVGDHVHVPMRWKAGLHRKIDQTAIFYTQATAVAQFLFQGDETQRAALVELVRRYYEGTFTTADLRALTGLTSAQLGARVEAFAHTRAGPR